MRFLPSTFLTLLLSTLTPALYAGDLSSAQVSQTVQAYPKKTLTIGKAHQLERRQGNAGPLESTLSGSSSSYRSPTYAIMSSTSSNSMSMTSNPSSVSNATTAIASGSTIGVGQGAGAKAPSTAAQQVQTTSAATSGSTIGVGQGAGAKAPSTAAQQVATTSSSKGGAPLATGHWAAAGILAAGVGGLMI